MSSGYRSRRLISAAVWSLTVPEGWAPNSGYCKRWLVSTSATSRGSFGAALAVSRLGRSIASDLGCFDLRNSTNISKAPRTTSPAIPPIAPLERPSLGSVEFEGEGGVVVEKDVLEVIELLWDCQTDQRGNTVSVCMAKSVVGIVLLKP